MTLPYGNYFVAFLPILFALLLFVFFSQSFEWREAFLLSSAAWGIVVVLITEGLSTFNQLTYPSLTISWIIFDILAGSILLNKVIKTGFKPISLRFPRRQRFEYFVIAGILIVILTTGLIALVAPPNSFDSMNYHMSRIMHWMQDQNVAPFPTNITKQVNLTPGTEYEILQFQLLSGGDSLANMIQWFSFIGSIIGISLIARELGADQHGQLFSAAFCATIPIVILQASNTENHLSTAFWLVCFVYFSIHAFHHSNAIDILGIGSSLGLAILSKSTAYIFAAPFVILIILWVVLSAERKRIWLWIITALIVMAINGGEYIRDYSLYKTPLGPWVASQEYGYNNEIITPASITSNIIRNIALHVSTPSDRVNNYLYKIVHKIHAAIGISENDPRTTWSGSLHFSIPPIPFQEGLVENPLHLSLIIGTFGYGVAFLKKIPRVALYYILAVTSGFLFFCIFLKWQDWNRRLQIPLFILGCAIIGMTVAKIRPGYISNAIVGLFFVAAVPWLIAGQPRSLIGNTNIFDASRNEQYFAERPNAYLPYQLAAQQIEQMEVSSIGLVIGPSHYEYPLWVLLSQSHRPLPRIEHIGVNNETSALADSAAFRSFSPDVVVVTLSSIIADDTYKIDNRTYQRIWQSSNVIALYVPVKP
ncbi:MAG: glycosyltransferase family 39 protein [Anaerolineales bacterium]